LCKSVLQFAFFAKAAEHVWAWPLSMVLRHPPS
jgi:hypothetical protein